MKELDFLKIISSTINDVSLLGDDCACLNNMFDNLGRGICVTQDTLVEGVHFLQETTTAFELGQKAINVNLSDLAAAGAEPLFLTISLSLPVDVKKEFVEEFYSGVQYSLNNFTKGKAKIAGGDLTSSDKIFVSICAIGAKYNNVRVGRNCTKAGDIVAVTGTHGDSAGGLKLLADKNFQDVNISNYLIKKHLVPLPQIEKSAILMNCAKDIGIKEFAMMDSSDGLFDALYKLSSASNRAFDIDYDLIPVSDELKQVFPLCWKELAYWGGEDFELVFCMPKEVFDCLDNTKFHKIGVVSDRSFEEDNSLYKNEFEKKCYKHFKD